MKKSYNHTTQKFKVTFELPVTENNIEKDIRVLGDFNDWNWDTAPKMSLTENLYTTHLELSPGKKYEYRYKINNELWTNDNIADEYSPSPFDDVYNCVLTLDTPDSTLSKSSNNLRRRTVDFTKIKDLTLDIKIVLNKAGILTYSQLADTSFDTLSSILGNQNFELTPEHYSFWIDKAEKLDAEDW